MGLLTFFQLYSSCVKHLAHCLITWCYKIQSRQGKAGAFEQLVSWCQVCRGLSCLRSVHRHQYITSISNVEILILMKTSYPNNQNNKNRRGRGHSDVEKLRQSCYYVCLFLFIKTNCSRKKNHSLIKIGISDQRRIMNRTTNILLA